MTMQNIKQKIEQIESEFQKDGGVYFCPNHMLEVYLYEYYFPEQEYNILSEPLHRLYYQLAKCYEENSQWEKVKEALIQAKEYNPVDIEILESLVLAYYHLGELDQMFNLFEQWFPFIFTRQDLAVYYSLLGCYYLEKYQPDIAEGLYMYSNMYCENTQAKNDLAFIEKAVGRTKESHTPEELMEFLAKHQIELQPKKETLGIMYHVALLALKEKNMEYAGSLLMALYELTQDQEVYQLIMDLKSER